VLRSLDDKIELNRQMNQTLEALAQAVFEDWFVAFGPTRRKMAGETGPAAILGGLLPLDAAAPLAPLFPDRLGDNGLPLGWEEKPLDEVAEFLNGLALQKFPAKLGEPSLPVIKIAELRNGVSAKSDRASRDLADKYIIQNGDFIFSWSGSLMAKFWTEGEGALNQHLFKVSSQGYPTWFFSRWVHQHLDEFQRIAASKATTMGHIQRGHLKAAMTVDPGAPALKIMDSVMGPLLQATLENDLENQTLAATRDLLLPKLMSGELRLVDGEGGV
jgi:type I restriction enzyme S subunit